MSQTPETEPPFFIGFAPIPKGLVLPLAIIVAVLMGMTVGLALIIAGDQRAPGRGQWLADNARQFEGFLHNVPYPTLFYTDDTGVPKAAPLMSTGKQGVVDRVRGLDGRRILVEGFLIERDGETAIEFIDGNKAVTGLDDVARKPPRPRSLGTRTLRGEIIDSKCFLGVMKPGYGKTHKACATLCIIGGVPPQFVVRHEEGLSNALLAGPNGAAIPPAVLSYVGEPVEVTGELEKLGPLVRFRIDPTSIRRL